MNKAGKELENTLKEYNKTIKIKGVEYVGERGQWCKLKKNSGHRKRQGGYHPPLLLSKKVLIIHNKGASNGRHSSAGGVNSLLRTKKNREIRDKRFV